MDKPWNPVLRFTQGWSDLATRHWPEGWVKKPRPLRCEWWLPGPRAWSLQPLQGVELS